MLLCPEEMSVDWPGGFARTGRTAEDHRRLQFAVDEALERSVMGVGSRCSARRLGATQVSFSEYPLVWHGSMVFLPEVFCWGIP